MSLFLITVLTGCGVLTGADEAGYSSSRNVGTSAHDLLAEERFKRLAVEIQAVQGYAPTEESVAALKVFLEERLHKSGGIRIINDPPIASPGGAAYTPAAIRDLEQQRRKTFSQDDEIATYILFLDGKAPDDTHDFRTLGQAYWNTSIALYAPSIRRLAIDTTHAGTPSLPTVESIVMMHEFGHLLGLVGSGTPLASPHQDAAHAAHCNNPLCLMHFAVGTEALFQNIYTEQVPRLDSACLADLQANGGR